MKGMINIKNNDNKCFLWCYIRYLNLVKTHPERITKEDKNMVDDLDYKGITLPVSKKDYCKIERQNNICINAFCYENRLAYPVYLSDQKFVDFMDLLLMSNENKSHYVYVKDFKDLFTIKLKLKIKNIFVNVVYNVLVAKKFDRTHCKIKKWFN